MKLLLNSMLSDSTQ